MSAWRLGALGALAIALGACDTNPPLTDCGGDLRGVWRAPGTSPSGEPRRFQLIAGAWSWELYPMFDDGVVDVALEDGVLAAPSAIDVLRFADHAPSLFGTWTRRYERRNHRCVVSRPLLISQCRGDALTLTTIPPPPPLQLETCAPSTPTGFVETRLRRE